MQRVLVTGHAGFIGGHLVTALTATGRTVVGLDVRSTAIAGVETHEVDILDRHALIRAFEAARPDVVVHLAARTDLMGKTVADYPANTKGVENLAAAVAATPSVQRVLVTSTQLVCRPGYAPASDTDYAPHTAYGESKVEGERIWRAFDGGGRTWCLLRPTTIWGPRMNPHYLRFFSMIRSGRYFHVGRAPVRKSYGFVGNTVAQLSCLLSAPAESTHRRTFYLADPPIDLAEWAEAFRAELGAPRIPRFPAAVARAAAFTGDLVAAAGWRSFPFTTFRLRNVMVQSVVDTAPLQALCGAPRFSVAEGVARTAEWLREVWSAESVAQPAHAN
jgi:nucleoside-diphosphate-sugar epimerase